jgi:dihydroorotase
MVEQPKYDLLLRGGRVVCPATGTDGIRDVAIRGGRIAAIEHTILPSSAQEIIDVSGKLVLPGLIDTHAHVYQYVTGRFGLNPDLVGVRSGVTTVVDQGGPSCMTLPGFRSFIVQRAKTQVYAFLSAYLVGGLEGHYYPNLYSPDGVDIDATVAAANANKDIVRGIKGHAEIGGFARWGIKVLEMSAEIGRRAELPLYVHFGTLWGLPESGANGEDADTILERVIPKLRAGDILAHPFTRHPGGSSRDSGGPRPRAEGGRRPRQPFLVSHRPQGARCWRSPAHTGSRHAWLQYRSAGSAGNTRTTLRRREPSVPRSGSL